MERKKQQILETAIKLFMEKGYAKTSMQDVAGRCNVSKATLYKFFRSKEEIGMLAECYLTEQLRITIDQIMEQEDLFPQEILRASIVARMNQFSERVRLINEMAFSMPPEARRKYLAEVNKNRFAIFEIFSKVIMKSFGVGNEPLAAELTINLNGLLREVTLIAGEEMIELDEDAVADFIVDSLQAIMEKRIDKKPLLTQQQLYRMRQEFIQEEQQTKTLFRKKRLMQSLQNTLAEYEETGHSGRLQEAAGMLEELKQLTQIEQANRLRQMEQSTENREERAQYE